jgi:1-acyl-sn-glycerol-3-phosphate acyltransferase
MRKLAEHFHAVLALVLIPLFTAMAAALVLISSLFEPWGGRKTYNRIVRPWSRFMLRLAGEDLTIENPGSITEDSGTYIVVFNHQSLMDICTVVAAIPLQIRFVGKDSLGKIPIFGHAARRVGCVFIDRKDREDSLAGMEKIAGVLKKTGMSIVIAPEGTRSPDDNLLPFKKGAFVMAIDMGVPILPLTLHGTRDILPKKSLYTRPGKVTARIHEPITVEGLTYEDRDALSEKVRAVMENALTGENSEHRTQDTEEVD